MTVVAVLCSHSNCLRAVVRVYFTLGMSSVEANSVVTICIVGDSDVGPM